MVRWLRKLLIDEKDQFILHSELDATCQRHMSANQQAWEATHTVVVSIRYEVKALIEQVKSYHDDVTHHLECHDEAIKNLTERMGQLEGRMEKLELHNV